MAGFDWPGVTSGDYLTVEIFDTVMEYQRQLKELVLLYLNRNVFLTELDTSRGIATIPFAQFVNVVEDNLKLLVGTDMPARMPSTKIWRGGLMDEKPLDYKDVNRWFEIINALYAYILRFMKRYRKTGRVRCGYRYQLQVLTITGNTQGEYSAEVDTQ